MDPAQQYHLINNPQFKESEIMTTHPLLWKKFPILNDGFICLSDFMGNDAKIASRARTSYGKDRVNLEIEAFKKAFPHEPEPESILS